MAKHPPVPPANHSDKGPAASSGSDPKSDPKISRDDAKRAETKTNLKRQGDAGNIAQNTTHQGYQQDR
jgi:hypothetical protein